MEGYGGTAHFRSKIETMLFTGYSRATVIVKRSTKLSYAITCVCEREGAGGRMIKQKTS